MAATTATSGAFEAVNTYFNPAAGLGRYARPALLYAIERAHLPGGAARLLRRPIADAWVLKWPIFCSFVHGQGKGLEQPGATPAILHHLLMRNSKRT